MKIYHVETQGAYDELMIELEEKGCTWISGEKLTDFDEFNTYGIDTYVYDECCKISASSGNYFKAHHSDELVIEYKAKGEEMKHNLQEVESNLKEAKVFVKKLIEKIDEYLETLKPKFKAGDIVSSEILPDGCGIVRLEEDLTNELSEVYGIWYTNYDCEIQESDFVVFKEDTRHATPEEIAEYESALTFHKHGRKPFEVKDGDLLESVFGKYIAHEHPFSKEDFTVGGNTLLKTAEEVNEWLENK